MDFAPSELDIKTDMGGSRFVWGVEVKIQGWPHS